MDVEKLKKMNALVQELQKHNFASDSNDAVKQAEGFFQKKIIETDCGTVIVEKKQEPQNDFEQRKLERKFGAFRDAISALAVEIDNVKNELRVLSNQTAKLAIRQTAAPAAAPAKQEAKTKTKEPHPRQGRFTSEDVSVEKFFYFGKK